MRELDIYPASLTSPDGASLSPVRLIGDRLPDNTTLIRVYRRLAPTLEIELYTQFLATSRQGNHRTGNILTSDGSYHYSKSGGCGCGDPLKKLYIGPPE